MEASRPLSLTWIRPSSVPAYNSPSTTGDSASEVIVLNVDIAYRSHALSQLCVPPMIGRVSRSWFRVRSPEIGRQSSPRLSLRQTRCEAK